MQRLNLISTLSHQAVLPDGSPIYYDGILPQALDSIQAALLAASWRTHYQPFASLIVNTEETEALLIRDHLGVAPLYYYYEPARRLVVGATIPEILEHLPRTPLLLDSALTALFSENACYSDETLYQGIKRVEPGYIMHFKSNGGVEKRPYWALEREGETLFYKDDQEYLQHFSMLMDESIQQAAKNQNNIAAEFSAGLDSSAVYCASIRNHLSPCLYMHEGLPGTEAVKNYNDRYEKAFIQHYQLKNIKRIGAEQFDPIQIFKDYAAWFAGPAPYLFFMFANPVHRAVAAGSHPILLSGFGGDQAASGQIPLNFFIPHLIHQGEYKKAWLELAGREAQQSSLFEPLKRACNFVQFMHPGLYQTALALKHIRRNLHNPFHRKKYQPFTYHPYHKKYHRTLREAEWFLLQGAGSHEIRMRIEYSSIVSKKMGFEYRYPLLYPPLLEFILNLPLNQKRRDKRGRYLMHRYLAQCVPGDIFALYKKAEGMGIVPATFDLYKQNFTQGCYQQLFKNLPYHHFIERKNPMIEMRHVIKGFMLQAHQNLINKV